MNFSKKFEYLKNFIGKTPLLHVKIKFNGKIKDIFVKCEWYNFSGSVKDRAALNMLKNAYLEGKFKENQEIIEVTSGNMGISLAAIGSFLGTKVKIFMPLAMSEERKKLITLYGANLVLCENFSECFKMAEEYEKQSHAFYTRQFENIYNKLAQQEIAKEILKNENVDSFVSGVGTSGTLSGVGEIMKKKGKMVFAIDPASSSLLTLGYSKGNHKIQGLSDGIIPKLYDEKLIDKIIPIPDEDAIAMARKLNSYGISCGISGGANFLGSVLSSGKRVATVFADDNKKYLSTDLSKNIHTDLVDSIEFLEI